MSKFTPYLAALSLALLPAAASAAITKTYSDRPGFVAAVANVLVLPLALAGAPPVFVQTFVVGDLTLSAMDDRLAGDGIETISTAYEYDTLILDFAKPIFGVGLFGGVVDADFTFFDGELLIEAVGSGSTSLTTDDGAAYLGLLSDVGFTQLRISLTSFDSDFSSIGFVALAQQVDQAAAIPEPGTWALMIGGFLAAGTKLRARRVRRVAA